ncbi:YaaL family protein [Fictibacillus phosphorivorans]|uniref:YaaL family protein n=1 Tax=Fictibacillus phosphorivorans TaxID=1221500 RepID=UPI00203FCC0E|nr:YaaL family protein [Fictibacillus phosphorivorans]MCM3720286.1 YaaL family protein [Fictibacillus phosphorivorans]MCM3777976.1 YaaL family protein [Fictibacillus phosphorivorans]
MFFSRKGRLKRSGDQQLLQSLNELKAEWMHQKAMVERSVEPSEEVIFKLQLAESKYFFLLKEAKKRNVTTSRLK